MARLSIALLGGFQVTLDDLPLQAFESDKGRALLAYLAVENLRSHRRQVLAGLFWPNRPEGAARADLRQALHRLRQTIDDSAAKPPTLLVSYHEVQFNRKSDYHLDVEDFYRRLAIFQNHHPSGANPCPDCLLHLENAANLYQGDFLAGITLPGAMQFQWWMLCKQEEYHHQAMQVLSDLASAYEYRGDYDYALKYSRQKISLEPWYEPAHRRCMRLLALCGQRGAALQQYESCREILAAEMSIEPSPLTRQLREQILEGLWEKV